MDVESTIEFILQQQAKTEVRMDRFQTQMDQLQTQMDGMRKLVRVGMRMIAKQGEQISQLAAAQQVTEVKLQGLIDALRRGGNGHQSS
jgi:hypothetical protein